MFSILNRISWILSFFISNFFVNLFIFRFIGYFDFYFWSIVISLIFTLFVKKIFFSREFIENNILKFNDKIFNKNFIEKSELVWKKIEQDEVRELLYKEDEVVDKEYLDNWYEETLDDDISMESEDISDFENPEELEEEIEKEPSKIAKFLSEFFAENLMAKIWWILLSIWLIFLMSLVYAQLWDTMKIIIGFVIGFVVYFIWTLIEKKWYKTEWFILLWTWILINYIVILTWRFIILEWIDWWFMSSSITFMLLVFNTIFSVLTAFIYKSKNLLLFSLVFSYVIPFLTWTRFENYELVLYSVILSLGWFSISNYYYNNDDKQSALLLNFISLIWWNILLTLASLDNGTIDFTYKMIGFNIINFLSLYLLYKNKFEKEIINNFVISYIFLAIIMFSGYTLTWLSILVTFVIALLGLLVLNSYFLIIQIAGAFLYMLFFPLIFVIWFLFLWWVDAWFILIPFFLIVYLIIFSLMTTWSIISNSFKYVFFSFLWWFLIIWNSYLNIKIWLDNNTFWSIFVTSFIFLFSSYYLSSKNTLNYLYTLGTIASIILLLPIIRIKWDFANFSILAISLFWISNYLLPFVNKNLVKNDTQNLILWSIFGIIFVWLNLYRYWIVYFPWVSMWLWFLTLAILYFIWGYILFTSIDIKKEQQDESEINFIYAFLWIAISLFSISVAFIFAKMPAIIAMIWLFQSTIVLYFSNKLWKEKIYYAWIILFVVWLAKYWYYFIFLINNLTSNFGSHLIWNILIWISIFLNIIIFRKKETKSTIWVNILHIVWVTILWLNIGYLFTDYIINYFMYWDDDWILIIIIWILILILSVIYNLIWNKFTKQILVIFTFVMLLYHIFSVWDANNYSLNYVFTIIIWIVYMIDRIAIDSWKINTFNSIFTFFSYIFSIYLFVITSIYLYDATDNYFILTIYWWVLSLLFVYFGLSRNKKAYRTIWLYILIITLLKIIFYDISNWIDDWIIRIVAFMFVGWIIIFISSIYKSMWFKIKEDLNFNFGEHLQDEIVKNDKKIENKNEEKVSKQSNKVNMNADLEEIDIGDKKSIVFIFNDWKKISIRAKNLIKMWIIVIQQSWKNIFEKWELKATYNYIKSNYKSELNKRDYDKIIEILDEFVKQWGKVEII